MKILCVCNQGNNRSVQLAHLLKYWNNDTIPIGLDNTSKETLEMLYNWADIIISTTPIEGREVKIWPVEDIYPRPFNKELHRLAKQYLEENKSWLKG